MITRLLELKLSGFRCFSQPATIPLEADVILIHGLNGTGKTTVLTAIEFAVTGCVEELSPFEADYPRCLRNVDSSGPAFAAVTYLAGDDSQQASEYRITGDPIKLSSTSPPVENVRFFRDRCYLSQSSLSRLLETYQAHQKTDGEQPLVRFIRELLGLQVLDNITAGLFEAANISRIEKSVPLLAQAREEERVFSAKLAELRVELGRLTNGWQQVLAALQAVIAQVGDPAPSEPWTTAGVIKRAEAHAQQAENRSASRTLQRFRHGEGRLQRIHGVLGAQGAYTPVATLRHRLNDATKRLSAAEAIITPVLEQAEKLLEDSGRSPSATDDITARFEVLETALQNLAAQCEAKLEALQRAKAEFSQLQSTEAEIAKKLAELEPNLGRDVTASRRWAETLAAVLQHVRGDDCPVCGRDYREVDAGSLKEHVQKQIAVLADDAKRLERIARERAPLVARSMEVKSRLQAAEVALKALITRAADSERLRARAKTSSAAVVSIASSRREWQQLTAIITALRSEIAVTKQKDVQQTDAIKEIAEITREISVPATLKHDDPRTFASAAADYARQQADILEGRSAVAGRLGEALARAKNAGEALLRIQEQITESTRRFKRAQQIQALTGARLASARKLSKAALNAKTRLLSQVFNDQLNTLWRELFRRLVKHEQFQPRLAEPSSIRGQIRTSIQGWREDVDVFEQFAAVASSGNLNTAALSLFLSLNLIEQPRHRLLLLDDPVQAMDDVHVVQLASLLREIRRQAGRQLILAVHERALFDYLRLELAPTGMQSSLRTIELRNLTQGEDPIVETNFYPWKPDKVSFAVPQKA